MREDRGDGGFVDSRQIGMRRRRIEQRFPDVGQECELLKPDPFLPPQ